MADNIGYTPGSGATVAADEIGGVLFQRMKIGVGDDGAAVDVSANNPMPVADAQNYSLLLRLLNFFSSPLGFDKSLQRQRSTAVIESGTVTTVSTVTTVTTVSTVSTLANQTSIGGVQAQLLVNGQNIAAWYASVRSRIT